MGSDRQQFLCRLAPDLKLDLDAFCEAHYSASRNQVVETALRAFIDAELKAEPRTYERFLLARQTLTDDQREIKIVDAS